MPKMSSKADLLEEALNRATESDQFAKAIDAIDSGKVTVMVSNLWISDAFMDPPPFAPEEYERLRALVRGAYVRAKDEADLEVDRLVGVLK